MLVASAYVLRRERLGCGEGARGAGRCAELAARGAAPMGRLGERRVLRDGEVWQKERPGQTPGGQSGEVRRGKQGWVLGEV